MLFEKVNILAKYLDFTAYFLKKSAMKFSKYFAINKYLIDLEPNKQLFYMSIYSSKLVECNIIITKPASLAALMLFLLPIKTINNVQHTYSVDLMYLSLIF